MSRQDACAHGLEAALTIHEREKHDEGDDRTHFHRLENVDLTRDLSPGNRHEQEEGN
ncbi:hypothetical protein D3C87_1731940 [compost metagenome]